MYWIFVRIACSLIYSLYLSLSLAKELYYSRKSNWEHQGMKNIKIIKRKLAHIDLTYIAPKKRLFVMTLRLPVLLLLLPLCFKWMSFAPICDFSHHTLWGYVNVVCTKCICVCIARIWTFVCTHNEPATTTTIAPLTRTMPFDHAYVHVKNWFHVIPFRI